MIVRPTFLDKYAGFWNNKDVKLPHFRRSLADDFRQRLSAQIPAAIILGRAEQT
jgi:hypothetical protein